MTFVLVSVVLETAANRKSTAKAQAPLAIGERQGRGGAPAGREEWGV
jgi:hypothetical protein